MPNRAATLTGEPLLPPSVGQEIFGQLYDAQGAPDGDEFQISDPASVAPDKARVSFAADAASYVVVWQDADADGKGIFARWIQLN